MKKSKIITLNKSLLNSYWNDDFNEFCRLIENGANIDYIDEHGISLIANITENRNNIKDNKLFFDKLIDMDVSLKTPPYGIDLLSISIMSKKDLM